MAASSAVYLVNCTKLASPIKLHKIGGKLQTLLKARKIRIFSGRVCIVITILHLQGTVLSCISISLFPTQYSYPQPTFGKIKNKLQSMQLCKYTSTTKAVFQQTFQTFNKEFFKKV